MASILPGILRLALMLALTLTLALSLALQLRLKLGLGLRLKLGLSLRLILILIWVVDRHDASPSKKGEAPFRLSIAASLLRCVGPLASDAISADYW